MKATFPLGRYAGVPVGVHWSVLLIMLVLADLLAVRLLPAAAPGAGQTAYWVTAHAVTVLFTASRSARSRARIRCSPSLVHRRGIP